MQNEDAIAILKAKISANALRRIRDAADEISRPKILHTQYLGDRTVQQLGQEPNENAVILNNSANAIGDALMPLAKGQPLQRFDSVNQDDGVGTAKRALLDYAANRDGSSIIRLRTGEQEPANDPLKGTSRGRDPLPKDYPPPFGCVPLFPAKQCIWIPSATPPSGYQSHGSAVINEDGLELWLHCKEGVVPPPDLGCTFLSRWKCVDGVCTQDPSGSYATKAACETARIPANFTGGQCVGTVYSIGGICDIYDGNGTLVAISAFSVSSTGAVVSVAPKRLYLSNGQTIVVAAIGSTGETESGFIYFINNVFNPNAWTFNLRNITLSGSPDNCGDRFTCP